MILHSILPEELVMEGFDKADYSFSDVKIDGISMQVEFVDNTQARIVRLYSNDPNDFLNPRYAPGTVIHYVASSRNG